MIKLHLVSFLREKRYQIYLKNLLGNYHKIQYLIQSSYPKLRCLCPKLWRQFPINAQKLRVGADKFRVGYPFFFFFWKQIILISCYPHLQSDKTNCIFIVTSRPFDLYLHLYWVNGPFTVDFGCKWIIVFFLQFKSKLMSSTCFVITIEQPRFNVRWYS